MISLLNEYGSMILIFAVIAIITAWIKSGHSPFVLMIKANLHLEAIRLQTLASLLYAVRDFKSGYAERVRVVRSEVVGEAQ